MANIGELTAHLGVDTSGLNKGVVAMKNFGAHVSSSINGVKKSLFGLQGAFVSIGGAFLTKKFIGMADSMIMMESRLRLVTDSSEQLKAVQEELLQVANRSSVSYEATGELYSRLGRVSKTLGVSHQTLLDVTEGISKAMIVSGATAQEAGAAMIQLSQGLAAGALRGDELRSVMEQTPRLAMAIADGMGVTLGKFRELAMEGKITSAALMKALVSQLPVIEKEFSQMQTTVGQAMTVLGNELLRAVGIINKTTGVTKGLGDHIMELANKIHQLASTEDFKTWAKGTIDLLADMAKGVMHLVGWIGRFYAAIRVNAEDSSDVLKSKIKVLTDQIDTLKGTTESEDSQGILGFVRSLFGEANDEITNEAKRAATILEIERDRLQRILDSLVPPKLEIEITPIWNDPMGLFSTTGGKRKLDFMPEVNVGPTVANAAKLRRESLLGTRNTNFNETAVEDKAAADKLKSAIESVDNAIQKANEQMIGFSSGAYAQSIANINNEAKKYSDLGVSKTKIDKMVADQKKVLQMEVTKEIEDAIRESEAEITAIKEGAWAGEMANLEIVKQKYLDNGASIERAELVVAKKRELLHEQANKNILEDIQQAEAEMVGVREGTLAKEMRLLEMKRDKAIKDGTDATEAFKLFELEKQVVTKQVSKERLEAERNLYEDLRGYSGEYFEATEKLILNQAEEWQRLGINVVAINAWIKEETTKALIAMGQKSNEWKEGMVAAFLEIQENAITAGRVAYEVTKTVYEETKTILSGVFRDAMRGELDSFKAYFVSFAQALADKWADLCAQIVTDWIFAQLQMRKASAGLGGGGGGGLLSSIFGGILDLFSGGTTGGYGDVGQGIGLRPGFAKGAAFYQGNLVPYALGGIVNQPTFFPMARGAGLMGENGYEGILPLTRTKGGKLGVHAISGEEGKKQSISLEISLDPGLIAKMRHTPEEIDVIVSTKYKTGGLVRSVFSTK